MPLDVITQVFTVQELLHQNRYVWWRKVCETHLRRSALHRVEVQIVSILLLETRAWHLVRIINRVQVQQRVMRADRNLIHARKAH